MDGSGVNRGRPRCARSHSLPSRLTDDVGERHRDHLAFAGEASWLVRFRVRDHAEPLPALAGGQRPPHYK